MRFASLLLFAALGLALTLLLKSDVRSDAPAAAAEAKQPRAVMVIHGGAGVLSDKEMAEDHLKAEQFEAGLAVALAKGYQAWQVRGTSSVDAVETAIRVMEDCDLFNAGKGAALDNDGRASLDASIMEGKTTHGKGDKTQGKMDSLKRAGAVAGVHHIKNPISAARAVMEDQRHVLLIGEGAEWFALSEANRKRYNLEMVSNAYFWTDRRLKQIRKDVDAERSRKQKRAARLDATGRRGRADRYFGTVGAVALKDKTLAAGTSTGGLTNKLRGRVGDSPLIGSGTYADDRACGVSCTGTGEVFIRHAVAHDVIARMLYKKIPVGQAVKETIEQLPDEKEGVGGLIALDAEGHFSFGMSRECDGMYRGYVTEKGDIFVGLLKGPMKPMKNPLLGGK